MKEATSFSKKDISQLLKNFSKKEMDFFVDIITLREHLKKVNGVEITLPEATLAYLSQFHPEIRNIKFIISTLHKG